LRKDGLDAQRRERKQLLFALSGDKEESGQVSAECCGLDEVERDFDVVVGIAAGYFVLG
jgi:hypothetical protein